MIYSFGSFEFDDELMQLRRSDKVVRLELVSRRVLAMLLRRAGEVVTKEDLLLEVWEGRNVADNCVTVAMARLRKALDTANDDGDFVLTLYGRGYRFVGAVVARPSVIDVSREVPSSPPASALDVVQPLARFVGRERVLSRLRQALSDAQSGRGRLCALVGEAGIGKTRVVEALQLSLAGQPVRVAWGFCREAGDTPPLWPWLRLLREVAASSSEGQSPDAVLRDLLERLECQPPADGSYHLGFEGAARHRTFEAIAQAFVRAAQDAPWLLVLDDLHRADGASLELLGQLVDELAHARILIVATLRHSPGRPSPRTDTHLPYVLAHRNCERIALERLSESEVVSYLGSVIDDPDARLGHAVYAKSEGNPFYMVEMERQLVGSGSTNPQDLAIPGIALDSFRRRVHQLGAEAREVLVAACVIGRSFELPILQAVTDRPWASLLASLDDAIASDIVVEAPDSTTAFAFGHDLMRSVLYDELAPAERRRWHVKIGEALERRLSVGHTVPPSELAYHLHAGLPESDLRKTVQYCRLAAASAAAVYANSDFVRYLRNALEALDLMDRSSARLRLRMWYWIAAYGRGQPSLDYVGVLRQVIALARDQGDGVMLLRAAIMFNQYPGFQPLPGARAVLEHAHQLLSPELPSAMSVALSAIACTAPESYDGERVRELLTRSLALAKQSGSRAATYVGLVSSLYLLGGPAHEREAESVAVELAELYRREPIPELTYVPLFLSLYRAVTAMQRGDRVRVTAAIDVGISHAREIGNSLQWHFERFQVLAQLNEGAWSEALPKLTALHRRAERTSLIGADPFIAFDQIVIFGEVSGSAPHLDDALRRALDFELSDPPSIWAMKVRALAAVGLHSEALGVLRVRSAAELARLPCDSQLLGTLGHLARACVQLGAHEYVEALESRLRAFPEHFAIHFSFVCEGSVPHLLGMLAMMAGRYDDAIPQLETAIVMSDRAGFLPCAADARWRLALALAQQGTTTDRRRARGLAKEAETMAQRFGMRTLARETERLPRGWSKPE
ncbi:MAG: hypothetical protein RLZZ450_2002 [Pseudomonadota bacterium]